MKTPSPFAGKRNPAFTLIELLTAVAIVSILAALVSTGLVRMRKTANQAGCLNNLRQIGVAWHQYLADNNRKFPAFKTYDMYYWGGGQGTWGGPAPEMRPLYPYLSEAKVFRCPSDQASAGRQAFHRSAGSSYAMANSQQRGILSMPAATGRMENVGAYDLLQKPSATFLVFEQTARASEPGYKADKTANWYRSDWHPNDVSNILMADGHVETVPRAVLDARPHPLNPVGYSWGWSYISGGDW